jgi:hypothetical protein
MGRHVNFEDEQDRWLHKAEKLNRSNRKKEIPLEERDPGSLTIPEQIELARRAVARKKELKQKENERNSKKQPFISHHKPKD